MEVIKIDDLPQAAALADGDRLIINQADTSRANLGQVKAFIQGDLPERIDNAIDEAKEYVNQLLSGRNEWLPPVNTVSQLKTTGLDNKINYLCKVIADAQSGVYQAVAGWTGSPQWTLFDSAVDLVNEQELETAVKAHNTDTVAHDDIRESIGNESQERQEADQALQNNIDAEAQAREQGDIDTLSAAKTYMDQQIAGESDARQTAVQNLQAQLDGVQAIQLNGALLTRAINGTTGVAKNLFDPSTVFVTGKTLINDTNGTLGVFTEDIDGATIAVETKTVSAIATDEPTLLGNVANFARLPQTVDGAVNILGWNTPRIDDYARVLADETNNNKTVEWYIVDITDGDISWGNPVIINTADFQEQTTAQDSGRVLTGGANAGTFGQSLGIDATPTVGSSNLITSGAVAALKNGTIPRIVGMNLELGVTLDAWKLNEYRLMVPGYQLIKIADYPELCAQKYVGDAKNATADWWYKCDQNGNRTTSGTHMRVEAGAGLFHRAAGSNPIKTAADNTPYDGGAVGKFTSDAIRNITGKVNKACIGSNGSLPTTMTGALYADGIGVMLYAGTSSVYVNNASIILDVSRIGADCPTASENRPGSISVNYYIVY